MHRSVVYCLVDCFDKDAADVADADVENVEDVADVVDALQVEATEGMEATQLLEIALANPKLVNLEVMGTCALPALPAPALPALPLTRFHATVVPDRGTTSRHSWPIISAATGVISPGRIGVPET